MAYSIFWHDAYRGRVHTWLQTAVLCTSGCVAKCSLKTCKPMSKIDRTAESEMTYVRSRYRKIERIVSIWLQWSCQDSFICSKKSTEPEV